VVFVRVEPSEVSPSLPPRLVSVPVPPLLLPFRRPPFRRPPRSRRLLSCEVAEVTEASVPLEVPRRGLERRVSRESSEAALVSPRGVTEVLQ
jgi:hypothetical protein